MTRRHQTPVSSFRAKREIFIIRGEGLTLPPCTAHFSAFLICLSYRQCPIRPCGAPSPRGEGWETRIPSSKKTSHYPCDPVRSPYRHPERSRGIFIALPPYAHMRPHANDTLVRPFSSFSHSRLTALQEGSLHFGRDDKQNTNHLT